MADNTSYESYRAYCDRVGVQPMNEPMWRMMYGDSGGDNHVAGQSSAARQSARGIEFGKRIARPKEPTQGVRAKQHQPHTDQPMRPTQAQQEADIAQFLVSLWA